MAPIAAFLPLLGLVTPSKKTGANTEKRRPRKSRRRKAARTKAVSTPAKQQPAPKPTAMNALVVAWLADAALSAANVAPAETAKRRSTVARVLAALPWRRRRRPIGDSTAKVAEALEPPVSAEKAAEKPAPAATSETQDGTPPRTSPLYRSLYFSTTTRPLAVSADAESPPDSKETQRQTRRRLGDVRRGVPSYLLADNSADGAGLLAEVRAVWRRKSHSARHPFSRFFGTFAIMPFLLNPLHH